MVEQWPLDLLVEVAIAIITAVVKLQQFVFTNADAVKVEHTGKLVANAPVQQ